VWRQGSVARLQGRWRRAADAEPAHGRPWRLPPWELSHPADEIARLVRDIAAAEGLCEALPAASRDRQMVERTIVVLELLDDAAPLDQVLVGRVP
jgi:hypothetical protein